MIERTLEKVEGMKVTPNTPKVWVNEVEHTRELRLDQPNGQRYAVMIAYPFGPEQMADAFRTMSELVFVKLETIWLRDFEDQRELRLNWSNGQSLEAMIEPPHGPLQVAAAFQRVAAYILTDKRLSK